MKSGKSGPPPRSESATPWISVIVGSEADAGATGRTQGAGRGARSADGIGGFSQGDQEEEGARAPQKGHVTCWDQPCRAPRCVRTDYREHPSGCTHRARGAHRMPKAPRARRMQCAAPAHELQRGETKTEHTM